MVITVGDIEVAGRIYRNAPRVAELSGGSRAAVAVKTGDAGTGDDTNYLFLDATFVNPWRLLRRNPQFSSRATCPRYPLTNN